MAYPAVCDPLKWDHREWDHREWDPREWEDTRPVTDEPNAALVEKFWGAAARRQYVAGLKEGNTDV